MSYVQVSVDRSHPLLTNEFLWEFTDLLGDIIVKRLTPVEFALTKDLVEIEVRDYVQGVDRRDARYPLQVRIFGNNFPSRMVNVDERMGLVRADLARFIDNRVGMSVWLTCADGRFITL